MTMAGRLVGLITLDIVLHLASNQRCIPIELGRQHQRQTGIL